MEKTTARSDRQNASTAIPLSSLPRQNQSLGPPLSDLSRALGNQALGRLFAAGAAQTKLRVSQPGDADEDEADHVAEQVVSRHSAPRLQRKCACGGTCSQCQDEDNLIHRNSLRHSPRSLQRAPAPEADSKPERDPSRHPAAHPHILVVEDEDPKLETGQMRKSQFLSLFESTACATADAALQAVGHSTQGCPYIRKWLAHYRSQSAQHLLAAMRKYAPETAKARSAHEAISLLNQRVERAALGWAKTGKVSGLPEGMQAEMAGGGSGFLAKVSGFAHSGFGKGLLGFLGGSATPEISFGGKNSDKDKDHAGPGTIQKKAHDNNTSAVDDDAASVKSQLGSGQGLDPRLQGRMSSAFGYDFSAVRIHTDARAGKLSSQLNARAFTLGSDVAFASGEYQPGTLVGDALIAHELAHVVQQGGGKPSPQTKGATRTDDSQLEQDADHSAVGAVLSSWTGLRSGFAMLGANALPRLKSGLKLQRCKSDREKEIERLGVVQYTFMEEKRKADEAKAKKNAEEDAKKKGLPPPATAPKVELGDVIKKEEGEHALQGSPTTAWDTADQPAWRARAATAWANVVASVKGTELESVAKGVTFNFDPAAALKGGFYASQNGHTLTVGMSWVQIAEQDPKNVWENLAHEMAGHFEYDTTYASEIMDAALSRLSSADRKRFIGDPQKFFETYEYPETEIYASLWQRRYRVPVTGTERPSGGIHPDANIAKRLDTMHKVLHPEVAKAVLKELKRRVDANNQILQRDKDFFVAKVKEIFGYSL